MLAVYRTGSRLKRTKQKSLTKFLACSLELFSPLKNSKNFEKIWKVWNVWNSFTVLNCFASCTCVSSLRTHNCARRFASKVWNPNSAGRVQRLGNSMIGVSNVFTESFSLNGDWNGLQNFSGGFQQDPSLNRTHSRIHSRKFFFSRFQTTKLAELE